MITAPNILKSILIGQTEQWSYEIAAAVFSRPIRSHEITAAVFSRPIRSHEITAAVF